MLRQLLMFKGIFLSNAEFNAAMEMATEDIKFNNIKFNRKTKLNDVLEIVMRSVIALKRCG